jgi:hypothetical protein
MENPERAPVFVEAMTKFTSSNGSAMRVWSRLDAQVCSREEFVADLRTKIEAHLVRHGQWTADELALAVLRMREDITAVEVVDFHGNGVVLYGEW